MSNERSHDTCDSCDVLQEIGLTDNAQLQVQGTDVGARVAAGGWGMHPPSTSPMQNQCAKGEQTNPYT